MVRQLGCVAGLVFVAVTAACGGGVGEQTSQSSGEALSEQCGQTTIKGIDVFHGDNNSATINWSSVKAGGASFAFAKATQSTGFVDPMFAKNWAGMKSAGLVRGAYHFFDPAASASAQASFFLRTVGPVSPGDLLVLDFETTGGLSDATLASNAMTFLGAVKSATGLTPLLYASSEFLSNFGPLGAYPLWVADYGPSCPLLPTAWSKYTFWQSTGTGSFPGIAGQVDVDSFNGTLSQLKALSGSPSGGGSGGGTGGGTGGGGQGGGTGGTGSGSGSGGGSSGGTSCSTDGDCNPGSDGSGQICVNSVCVDGCNADWECPGNTTCVSGSCQ
jgi:GH25 family lysozyme M1 (1,4-beta-N-acetylmuramidase)